MTRYIDVAETAKMIRKVLKGKFPNTKFSVRSSRYAGGSSISISWFDGPTAKDVDAIVKPYESKGFDGMIDMAYYKSSYLLPDGSVVYGASSGTENSMGTAPAYEAELPEGAVEVSFGSDYVFTTRHCSVELMQKAVKETAEKFGFDMDMVMNAIHQSYDDSAYIDPVVGNKNVDGSDDWNLYWSIGSQVGETLHNMAA